MKKLSLTEVKRRIRNHEALPDDVVKWYPKLMSRYTIRKAKRNPSGFTGKESRPRLKRYGKGEYRRSARSKELYPRAFVKNPSGVPSLWYTSQEGHVTYYKNIEAARESLLRQGFDMVQPLNVANDTKETYFKKGRKPSGLAPWDSQPDMYAYIGWLETADNPSRVSRIKSHVKAHLDKDQRDFQREIDEDDELKMWLEKNPKFSASQRRKYAASGVALPDGSFPIRNRKDLMDALHDLGRTKHYAAAKRHIIKRARALGLTADLNPEWVRRKGKKHNPKLYRRMRNGDLVLAQ